MQNQTAIWCVCDRQHVAALHTSTRAALALARRKWYNMRRVTTNDSQNLLHFVLSEDKGGRRS